MLRVVITALVVAAIAGAVLYMVMSRNAQVQQAQQEQIEQLNAQLAAAQKENLNLKIALSKVQTEEQNLAMQNDALSKAIAQYKATGKMPAVNLPYPPK
jgi:peptidoglycan hydrolase CwlO-like protein